MYLRHFFGDRVTVRHLEMTNPAQRAEAEPLLAQVPQGYMFYPLVYIDGNLELVGSAEYYEVLYAVQQVLQPDAATDGAET